MIANKKEFFLGVGMMLGFIVVLIMMFSPIFGDKNALVYSDDLYNSISKGSAYYIPDVKEKNAKYLGNSISVILTTANYEQAEQFAKLLIASGADTSIQTATELKISGDLGMIVDNCLNDADAMYHNNGDLLSSKYGYEPRQVTYNWWLVLEDMDKKLKKQKKFDESKLVTVVSKKAVETAYNYYQIEPIKITDRIGIVLFSLVFYVIYTIWYGFAILFMFEGWGLKLGH